jgi:hypothetical protein
VASFIPDANAALLHRASFVPEQESSDMRLLMFVSLALMTIAAGEPPPSGSTPLPGPDPALPTVSAQALRQLTDNRIRQAMIAESIRHYRGECACPSQVDRRGQTCGKRAGRLIGPNHPKPVCTPLEISDEQVKAWREKRQH